jgi:hypothetical protein
MTPPPTFRVCAATASGKCIDEQVVKACLGDLHKVKKGYGWSVLFVGRKRHLKQNLFNIAMANCVRSWGRSIPHQTEEGEPKVEERAKEQ